jgi:adenylate cyclase
MTRILIVDDEPENREALKLYLGDENADWEILTSSGAGHAISLLKEHIDRNRPIDVILSDLVMENEQSGMTLLKAARDLDPLIISILVTAKEKNLDRYAAFAHGAYDVVEKNLRGASAPTEINIKMRAAVLYGQYVRRLSFLRRYFDPSVYDRIESDPEFLTLSNRLVTVAFWDIRGFSKLCEILKAEPELVSGFLRDYSEVAAQSIFSFGGVLDKFIGDGVMALFGVLEENGDKGALAACNAVQSAMTFQSGFNKILEKWLSKWKMSVPESIDIGLGCGLNTGPALVGNIGSPIRDQFTALGSTVNLAARIEGRSEKSEILLSQSTQVRVKSQFATSKKVSLTDIKNIPGTFEIYVVDGPI